MLISFCRTWLSVALLLYFPSRVDLLRAIYSIHFKINTRRYNSDSVENNFDSARNLVNVNESNYNQSQLLLKKSVNLDSPFVQLPRGSDISISQKENMLLDKRKIKSDNDSDLDLFRKEIRNFLDRIK